MFAQELDHEPIEQPGLLQLTSVTRPRQDIQLRTGYPRLQSFGRLMADVFAAGEYKGGTSNALVMTFGIGLLQCLELADDGLRVSGLVTLGKNLGEVVG